MKHIIFPIILSLYWSNPVNSQSKDYEKCYDYKYIETCSENYKKYQITNEENINWDVQQSRKAILKSCDPVLQCLFSISHCDMYGNPDITPLLDSVKVNCDLVAFLDDSPCYLKLRKDGTDCFNTWHAHIPEEELSNQLTRKVACRNYFGKNACLEEEVTRLCGKEEWAKIRDLYIALISDFWQECDRIDVLTGLVHTLIERNEGWKIKFGL